MSDFMLATGVKFVFAVQGAASGSSGIDMSVKSRIIASDFKASVVPRAATHKSAGCVSAKQKRDTLSRRRSETENW